jgi:hypothetical protein
MKRLNTYLIEKLKVSAKSLDIDAFKDEFNEFLNADTTWYFDILSDNHKIYTVKKDVNVSKILNSIYNTTGAKYIIQLKLNFDDYNNHELIFNNCELVIFKDSKKIREVELVFPTEFDMEFFDISIVRDYLKKEFKNFIAEFLFIENTEDFYNLLEDIYKFKSTHPQETKYKIKFL